MCFKSFLLNHTSWFFCSHTKFLRLPAARVLPKFIDEPPTVDPLQDVPFVVIPVRGGERGGQGVLVKDLQEQTRVRLQTDSPHGAAQLLVRHAAVLLLLTPHLSHGLRLQELKDALAAILPLHQALVPLGVDEDVSDELPKVSSSRSCAQTQSC